MSESNMEQQSKQQSQQQENTYNNNSNINNDSNGTDKTEIASQIEDALRFKLQRFSRKKCREEIDSYVECTKGKLFSVVSKCRDPFNDMNNCLKSYNNEENMEKLRHKFKNGAFTQEQMQRDIYEARKSAKNQRGDYI
eukprot:gb/GECH01000933.1/.p1 GENE.gb/GECH01000933.1/~~gb/GECH01000933.1/.p1  ORF type:complete len:138 (+),score=42.56 gb/GECH01000933.1/:1-414(+)